MKKSNVSVSKTITAPAERVWESVAAIGGIENWSSPIADSEVSGEGEGAKRVCNMADGSGKIYETIETIDHGSKIFQYSIQELPMPISNPLGTIEVQELGNGLTKVNWSIEFEVEEEAEEMMKEMIEGFYVDGIQGLERINQAA